MQMADASLTASGAYDGTGVYLLGSTGLASGGGDGVMASAMSMLEESCPAVHFVVPMFSNTTSAYHSASDEAHSVLGVLLLMMVVAWGSFVMEFVRVRTATRWSGVFQTMMGVYLLSWLFYFMHPEDVVALWKYSTTDMLQLQHLAIASLLCTGGLLELLQSCLLLSPMAAGSSSSSSGSGWFLAGSACLMLTGLVFMLHPQHTYAATIKHLLLGVCLVLGAPLYTRAKSTAWRAELDATRRPSASAAASVSHTPDSTRSNHVDWSMIVAGGSFALAACILLAFREHAVEVHIGTARTCQPAFVICALSYLAAGGITLLASIVALRHHCTLRRSRHSRSGRVCCSSLLGRWRRSLGWTALSSADDADADDLVALAELGLTPNDATTRNMRQTRADLHLAADETDRESGSPATTSASASQSPPTRMMRTSLAHPHLRALSTPTATHAPPHTLGDLGEYDHDDLDDDEEELPTRDRELQDDHESRRDRRRQEEYTGEEE